jgi:crotonobetaine/carnitine-CoA ligase
MSVARWFEALADAIPDRPLAYFEGEVHTYGAIKRRAWRLGSALQRRGVAGERVVTVLPSDPVLLALQLATLHAGGWMVPAMSDSKPDELRHLVDDARPAVVVASRRHWGTLHPLLRHRPAHVILTDDDRCGGLEALEEEGDRLGLCPVATSLTEPMGIMYTSGSTSRPKGVVVNGASLIKDAEEQPLRFGLADGESVLGCIALHHLSGWHQALGMALGCRGALMMQRRFSAARFWPDVDRSGAVCGLLMPAMVAILLARPEEEGEGNHPLRAVASHWRDERFARRFGVEFVAVWGQTETGGIATSGRYRQELPAANCVGVPFPGTDLEIRDDAGRALAPRETGEIWVRSPWIMQGYWNERALTAETVRDGWLRTGDSGWVDEDGRLYYVGRLKAMIKRAGENIAVREVEAVIAAHPSVTECAVFGVPDPLRTEEIKVVLTLRAGAEPDLPGLVEFCRERLADFKVPRYWEVRDELPRLERSMKVALQQLVADHETSVGWDRATPRPTTR